MLRIDDRLDGAVVHITLDAPKANVIDARMIGAIVGALESAVAPSTRLLVFEGAGSHFSFGASVEEHRAETAPDLLAQFHGMFRRLAEVAVPTCAVVRGQCLGGGLELAAWCTWIVATPDAQFGQPEIKLAVFPPMASLLLPWRAGGRAGLDLCVSGRSIAASEALRLGVVNAIVDDPEAWWMKLVETQLAGTSAAALRFAERASRSGLISLLDEELPRLERMYLEELMQTYDANEGITAFLERRAPNFLDR